MRKKFSVLKYKRYFKERIHKNDILYKYNSYAYTLYFARRIKGEDYDNNFFGIYCTLSISTKALRK